MALLSECRNDGGEFALAGAGDDVGSGRPLSAHAHIERPIEPKRETARGFVKLHRRDAEIEHNAVDRRGAGERLQVG